MNNHTPGPAHIISVGGDKYIGANGRTLCDLMRNDRKDAESINQCDIDGELLKTAYNAFDIAARTISTIDATELARKIDIVYMIDLLNSAAKELDADCAEYDMKSATATKILRMLTDLHISL